MKEEWCLEVDAFFSCRSLLYGHGIPFISPSVFSSITPHLRLWESWMLPPKRLRRCSSGHAALFWSDCRHWHRANSYSSELHIISWLTFASIGFENNDAGGQSLIRMSVWWRWCFYAGHESWVGAQTWTDFFVGHPVTLLAGRICGQLKWNAGGDVCAVMDIDRSKSVVQDSSG